MFSTSVKLLLRSQCCRPLHTTSFSIREQHLLQIKSNFAKQLETNVRFLNDRQNQSRNADPGNEAGIQEKKIRRKTPEIPKITLLDPKEHISVCTLEEAVKIAEGRHLRLVKIVDMDLRSKRPVYKLMTEAQYLEEELKDKHSKKQKKNSPFKGEKILILSCRITENDLQLKLKNTEKWVAKNFEVRVTISGPDGAMQEAEKVYEEFEKVLKGKARFLQKRTKGNDLKFQLVPLKDARSEDNEEKHVEGRKNKPIQVEEEEELENETNNSEESSSEETKDNILSKI